MSIRVRRAAALAGVLVVCAACESAPSRSDSIAPVARRDVRSSVKRHRVLVRGFTLDAADSRAEEITDAAARSCAQALARSPRCLLVLEDEVLAAPAAFQLALSDFELAGELVTSGRKLTGANLRAISLRDGREAARVELSCAPAELSTSALDALGLEAATQRLCAQLAEQPWTTSVLDKAERLLIVGGSPQSGLVRGEELVVRRVQNGAFERGIERWLSVPTVEVARVEVESFVGTDGATFGAQCRLTSGSFGGFDASELVVTQDAKR